MNCRKMLGATIGAVAGLFGIRRAWDVEPLLEFPEMPTDKLTLPSGNSNEPLRIWFDDVPM